MDLAIVGFESGSDKTLKFLRKGTTRQINLEGARILHENGVKIMANIMFGTPGETHEDVDQTMSMVREIKPEHFSAATFSPYPGSDLHDYCLKENQILNEYASRFVGEQKIRGIDYGYIQAQVDKYNSGQHKLKFLLKHSNFPVIKTARQLYKKVKAKAI